MTRANVLLLDPCCDRGRGANGIGQRRQLAASTRKQSWLIAGRGSASPFVFLWGRDVVGAIEHAVFSDRVGIYNVAGDGALGIREIAARLGKRCVALPAGVLRAALSILHRLGLSRYGPEQVNFLRYRPVLDNRRLKEQFGYVPQLSSEEVFELFRKARGLGRG